MMTALRMVWITSRHYNTDERMVGLMERLANQVNQKINNKIIIIIIKKKKKL
jgi:dynein heavy chain